MIARGLGLPDADCDLAVWHNLVSRLREAEEVVSIALVGKYAEVEDTYLSVREALKHAALFHNRKLEISWVQSDHLTPENVDAMLSAAQGIVVPGGFGMRGIEGMIQAARYARVNNIPYFGLCLGMQVLVIEIARATFGTECVNSTEFDPSTQYPVIDLLPDQRSVDRMGGTMRLGSYPCRLVPGTRASSAYGCELVHERHRHRFEFNNDFRQLLQHRLFFSGVSEDGALVEIAELKQHTWMLGCQFHPEFKSRPDQPHPLFREFMKAAVRTVPPGSQVHLPL